MSEMNITHVFSFIQFIQNILWMYNQYKIIYKVFYTSFIHILETYVFYLYKYLLIRRLRFHKNWLPWKKNS